MLLIVARSRTPSSAAARTRPRALGLDALVEVHDGAELERRSAPGRGSSASTTATCRRSRCRSRPRSTLAGRDPGRRGGGRRERHRERPRPETRSRRGLRRLPRRRALMACAGPGRGAAPPAGGRGMSVLGKLADVTRRPTAVKICGITRRRMRPAAERRRRRPRLRLLARARATIDPARAAAIARELPPLRLRVGVFVDAPRDEVEPRSRRGWASTACSSTARSRSRLLAACRGRVLKAVRVGTATSRRRRRCRYAEAGAAALLVDRALPGETQLPGGTRRTLRLVAGWRAWPMRVPLLVLAGGLTPENVARPIARRPPARGGRVERRRALPGRKDPRECGLRRGGARDRSRGAGRDEPRPRRSTSSATAPDAGGHFGPYGGRFVPETLMPPLAELERGVRAAARRDPAFAAELDAPAARLRRPADAAVPRARACRSDCGVRRST